MNPPIPRVYRPLARTTVRLGGLHRLYAADDHLLAVHDQVSTEEYRRFFFSDIQVLTVGRTHYGKILNVIFAILAAGLLGLLATDLNDPFPVVVFGIPGALCLVLLVLNLVAGPTGAMHVATAVQTDQLRGVGRLWKARRILAEIEPLIRAAQSGGAAPVAGGGASPANRAPASAPGAADPAGTAPAPGPVVVAPAPAGSPVNPPPA